MQGYLNTGQKAQCFGCEACAQACPKKAITITEDEEGFRYPVVDGSLCVGCHICNKVCPFENMPQKHEKDKYAFGGYHKDIKIRDRSTSGGAFSAIVDAWCDEDYVIFGAEADGLNVYHSYIDDKENLPKYCKSKYSQSVIGDSFNKIKDFLKQGKKVVFSGTPCQNAALLSFLRNTNVHNLLMIEVICEGVPSPLFVRKYEEYLFNKYKSRIKTLDYRYKDCQPLESPIFGKWDFQVMYTSLQSQMVIKKDRWFNPFWSIWLDHLMSRPSCYKCPFTEKGRVADITLGDLWGVHIYCPELYARNTGCSLIVCNTDKGKKALQLAKRFLNGHELSFEEAIKYQSPMRKHIDTNPKRYAFIADLMDENMSYETICKKWYRGPSIKLLWQKYVWGNRQKVFLWNLINKTRNKGD